MSNFFTKQESDIIVSQIASIELITIGELRIHVEDLCSGDPYLRAVEVFNKLEMYKTISQSGIIIYLASEDKKLSIIGDKGIHDKVGAGFWTQIVADVNEEITQKSVFEGISLAVDLVGKKLIEHFPEQNKPVNELSNEISYGKI
jgi:uncharacterized membrane protein